jgi:L-gulonolactone oxidase
MSSVSPPLGLSSLGSINFQTIAGAISTATHGSGWNFSTLSCYIVSIKILLADDALSIVTVSADSEREEDRDLYYAAVCGLGAIGVILEVKIKGEKMFKLREECWEMTLKEFVDDFEEVIQSGEHVRAHWFQQTGLVKISRLNRTDEVRSRCYTLSQFMIGNRFSPILRHLRFT